MCVIPGIGEGGFRDLEKYFPGQPSHLGPQLKRRGEARCLDSTSWLVPSFSELQCFLLDTGRGKGRKELALWSTCWVPETWVMASFLSLLATPGNCDESLFDQRRRLKFKVAKEPLRFHRQEVAGQELEPRLYIFALEMLLYMRVRILQSLKSMSVRRDEEIHYEVHKLWGLAGTPRTT